MWRVLFLFVVFRLSECKVRLVGGSSSAEGRVEIFHNGKWGTVCDDKWGIEDARVVCRSLGLPSAIRATTHATFGEGSGEIWLDEVQCRGNETSLEDCPRHVGWGENNCGHGEDAGVVCGHLDVVNINVSSLSGAIASPGYPHYMQKTNYEWTFRPSIPNTNVLICFEDLDLRTNSGGSFRTSIEDSRNNQLFSLENSKREDVCVKMESSGGKVKFNASLTTTRDDKGRGFLLRYAVVDRSQAEGFCSKGWDISTKGEAGRIELSWESPSNQFKSSHEYLVEYGSSDIHKAALTKLTSVAIDNLDPSTEYSIRLIAVSTKNEHSSALYFCSKRVRTRKERARVANGKSASEGYVQVYHAGHWTRVCGNYWWDTNDANVACRSMGLAAAKYAMVFYGKITKKNQKILLGNTLNNVWLSALDCTGREKSLLECPTLDGYGWPRSCYNDAGLVCRIPPKVVVDPKTSDWNIKIKPGIGKLDVSWAPHSNDSDYNYRIQYNITFYRNKTIDVHSPGASIDYLRPNTMYRVTVLALHKINGTVTKQHTSYMRTKAETIRISGGRIPNEGRVEVYHYNKWGVVCGHDWDMDDAKVACRLSGFPSPTAAFGAGTNPFRLKKKQPFAINKALMCRGFEMSLWECPKKRPSYRCDAASVVCGRPKECKTVIKEKQGTIRSERYFSARKMDCQWTLTAPSNTTLIVLKLRSLTFSVMAWCRESSLSYIDSHGRVLRQFCSGGGDSDFVMVGFAKIRLFMNSFFNPVNMRLDYFVSDNKLEDIVEAPNWNITAQSRSSGTLEIKWPYYKPTEREKSQNLRRVVKYVAVAVDQKNGRIITTSPTYLYSKSSNAKAFLRDLEYGEYTVFVLAYLGDSRNTPLTNWKKAARKSRSFTLKTREGRPLRAPTNVAATTTGTNSILVTWDPIPEKYANGVRVGYRVYKEYVSPYRGKVVDTLGSSVYGRNNTSYGLYQAFSNKTYTFRVEGFAGGGSGPSSPKVSATTGYEVKVYAKYGHFQASNGAVYSSNIHKAFVLWPWGYRFDEILIVFKAFDLENSYKCSNDYVQVTGNRGKKFGGRFCGKKSPFAVTVISKSTADVNFHSNAAIEKSGFSAFYKTINKRLNKQNNVWNLRVSSTSGTGAVVLWDIPAGNLSDVMVLFKESSVQYVWDAVKASPLDNRIILKDLLPAKTYHVRLVGTIFDVIQESQLKTFTTKLDRPKLDTAPK